MDFIKVKSYAQILRLKSFSKVMCQPRHGQGPLGQAQPGQAGGGSLVPAPIRRWMLAVIGAIADNPSMLDASGRVSALPARFVDRALDGYIVYDRG